MMNVREIRNRINSIKDTRKITNAMYMISSTKLRRVKNELERTRPYFDALHKEIKRIFQAKEGTADNRYFCPAGGSEATDGTHGLLVITADKGLAGAYNQNVIKEAEKHISEHSDTKLFVVGEYGRRYFSRQGTAIARSFLYTAQNPTMDRAREIGRLLLDLYDKGELDKIFIIYSAPENSLTTEVVSTRLLPFRRNQSVTYLKYKEEAEVPEPFEFYPSAEAVLKSVVKSWIFGFIYSALVYSFCSEQSARMTAMNSANQNAEKILEFLTAQYNQVRQAAITQEIIEITSGAKAQKRDYKKEVF